MSNATENTFKDGMQIGVHPAKQTNTSTRKVKNFRIISRDNNSFILTSVKGTEQKSALPNGFIPIAVGDKEGVAYILSAQVVAGLFTGAGEIGTFPSPDPSSLNLTYVYRPLMNYEGDTGAYPLKNGPFTSTQFNFWNENLVDIELQSDYDRSVNVIFTDGNNPMRIINAGFVVLPGNKYKAGSVSTNKYTKKNFENTISLIIRSAKLLKITFDGSEAGGSVLFGNTQYYFSYATADGNETEILGQSFNVPVYTGDRISNINGGKFTGDKSNKLNKFTLSNVDQSYAYLNVYVVHSDGMNNSVKTAYKLAQRYPISASSMQFIHTGYEEVFVVPVTSLISDTATIGTAGTISQSQGYLIAGDIKEKSYNIEALKKFSRMIRLGHKEVEMDLIGPEDNLTRAFDETIIQSAQKDTTDCWNGGYANPKNVHDRLGYWGGEAYPYTARYIFSDGFVSPLFPVVGIDNVNNNQLGAVDSTSQATIDALANAGGVSTDGKMLNTLGIYRFPNRNAPGVGNLFYKEGGTNEGRVTVNGITFKIPNLNTDLGDGKTIKDYTIGIQFFRGERKPDVIIQGTAIDAAMVPSIRFDQSNQSGRKLWDYQAGSGGYTEANSMLIPTYGYLLESLHQWAPQGGSDGEKRSSTDKVHEGIVPFKLNSMGSANGGKSDFARDPRNIYSKNKSPFALLSTDAIVNPFSYTYISAKDVYVKMLSKQSHKAAIPSARAMQDVGTGDNFSCLLPQSLVNTNTSYQGVSSWVQESTELKNTLGFSSKAFFQCKAHEKGSSYYLFRNSYNSYLGLRLDGIVRASNATPIFDSDNEGGATAYGLIDSVMDSSFLVNVYSGSSQRSALAVSQVYNNIDGITYFPISGRMYWDDTVADADTTNTIEGNLDENRKITLFNGDCFINFALRKLYSNAEFGESDITDRNAIVRVGYSIGIINESNSNASFRSSETVNLIEGERKHPFQYVTKSPSTGDSYGRNNPWREYYLNESAGYNKGYSELSGNATSATLPQNIPFTESNWFCRVWHSAKHIPNSFENGYRSFFARSYQDYNPKNGRIIKLIVNNNKLFCIQETSVGIIPMNERIQTGSDSAGAIFIESSGVLSPQMGMISEEIGSRHKNSIVSTDNGVYGASLQRNIIWATDGGPLARVSDLSIRPLLDKEYGDKQTQKVSILNHDIVAAWNKRFDEILFTYYNQESGNYDNDRTFTIQINETTKKMHSFYGFIPVKYFLAGDNLYSCSLKSNSQVIWLHDSDNVPFDTFYGILDKPMISFSVNENSRDNKSFTNLEIVGNATMPSKITYEVPGAIAEQIISSIENNIRLSNIKYKNRTFRLAIPKISIIHNQDSEQVFPDTEAGAGSLLQINSRVKARYLIIQIEYTSNDLIEIESVGTIYNIMR